MKKRNLQLLFTIFALLSLTPGIFAAPPQPSQERGHRTHRSRPYPAFLDNLPEAEQHRFKKLFRENPEEFRKEMHAYWVKELKKQKAELDAIGKRYRETNDAAVKKQLEQELRNKISQQFDKHLKFAEKQILSHENRIRQMQKRLDRLKAQTEQKKKNRQNEIDLFVKKILECDSTADKE